jgi:hypothetical protein
MGRHKQFSGRSTSYMAHQALTRNVACAEAPSIRSPDIWNRDPTGQAIQLGNNVTVDVGAFIGGCPPGDRIM